jgi:uncharacterized protein
MPISNIIGFDDCPFSRAHRGDVRVIGVVCAQTRIEGVLCTRVRKDGANATTQLEHMIWQSKFAPTLQLVLLQGVALAGFNVVDAKYLSEKLELPVLIVARRMPRLEKIKSTLLNKVPGGRRKWALIEQLGQMEPCNDVFVQRVGISLETAAEVLRRTTLHGNIPEALRLAHLIAGGITTGQSRGRT